MAVTDFIMWERGGSISEGFSRNYTRQFKALCNSPDDTETEIFQHPDCPVLGQPPRWDPQVFCVGLSAKWVRGTQWNWMVDAEFSSERSEDEAPNENPLLIPAKVSITSKLERVERYLDLDGRPITNTAGDLIKYPIDIPREVIRIQKNIGPFQAWIKDIEGVINASPVRCKGQPYDRGTLKVVSVNIGETNYARGYAWDECQIELEHRGEGWDAPVLNMGFYEWVDDPRGYLDKNGKIAQVKVRCLNDLGEPETDQCFLDALGRRPREPGFLPISNIPAMVIKKILDPEDIVQIPVKGIRYFEFSRLRVL